MSFNGRPEVDFKTVLGNPTRGDPTVTELVRMRQEATDLDVQAAECAEKSEQISIRLARTCWHPEEHTTWATSEEIEEGKGYGLSQTRVAVRTKTCALCGKRLEVWRKA